MAHLDSDLAVAPSSTLNLGKFASLHLPARDLAAARTFYVDVLGGTLVRDADVVAIRFNDFDIVAGQQASGGTPPAAEYPHSAFTVTPEQFVGLKRRLDGYKIPTNQPWTRAGKPYALMYFRDPTGNQFELFSPRGCSALDLRIGARAGGDYVTDFAALAYETLAEPKARLTAAAPTGLNHLTMPVRDLAEAKTFLVAVLGGRVVHNAPGHVTCVIGGVDVGVAPQQGGWTQEDAAYPHYCFESGPLDLAAVQSKLATFAVPSQIVVTPSCNEASLFFRDPSGNLFKIKDAGGGHQAGLTAQGPSQSALDPRTLCYRRWNEPAPPLD